jgi:SH3-like domain-containing protein
MDVLFEESKPGQRVALITMVGTFCPITLGHIEGFVQAREILLGRADTADGVRIDEPFDIVLGCIGLNGQKHAECKLQEKKELPPKGSRAGISIEDRSTLVALATQHLPWLNLDGRCNWAGSFPGLVFVKYLLNGADDVVKYQKWRHSSESRRFLTLGRPGFTAGVRKGIARCGADPRWCILAPELPDISSTAARSALRETDMERLRGLLDSRVVDWCVKHHAYGYGPVAAPPAKPPPPPCKRAERLDFGCTSSDDEAAAAAPEPVQEQCVCRQPSHATSTMLRCVKSDARTDDVWVASHKCVADGAAVGVLQAEGGWAQVRTTDGDATVGWIKRQYLHDWTPAEKVVRRSDGTTVTLLRRTKTHARVEAAWLASRACVRNGDTVMLLNVEDEWARVSTMAGAAVVGYIKLEYLV